ncbi:helix-turn-helix transcriptional regulator [Martelella sp.]|uniref:helix-turn-helix domain-containing protein n=1 Tax=Martelella sp. TaxID=1969699 RepID=UPI0025BDEBF5|nr:helix-turn-helix transcriptional regulator [Martelella sp.]
MNMLARAAIPVGMSTLREQQLAWLEHITSASGLTLTEVARKAGLHPSTLTRFWSRDDDGHTLTSSTVAKIEQATRVPAYEASHPKITAFAENEATPFVPVNDNNPVEAALKLAAERSTDIHLWSLKTGTLSAVGYPSGMIVAVDQAMTPRAGDAVCAQIYDFRRGTAETVFRVFRAPYLLSAAASGEPSQPELVDNERVVIAGVIVGGFTLRR